jgi:hypothetical protein
MQSGRRAFEKLLEDNIRYNMEHAIWPSETAICMRLLDRVDEVSEACEDAWTKVRHDPRAFWTFIDGLLGAAMLWNPEKMAEARRKRDRLDDVNERIAGTASELSALLRERTHIHNNSDFSAETHYHVLQVIDEAGRGNGHFESFSRKELRELRGKYDLKYWPSLEDFVSVLAADASNAVAVAHNTLTAAGTASSRGSNRDFFRAWFTHIQEHSDGQHLPSEFKLTDASYASFANVVLDLSVGKLVGSEYVKRVRQAFRGENNESE